MAIQRRLRRGTKQRRAALALACARMADGGGRCGVGAWGPPAHPWPRPPRKRWEEAAVASMNCIEQHHGRRGLGMMRPFSWAGGQGGFPDLPVRRAKQSRAVQRASRRSGQHPPSCDIGRLAFRQHRRARPSLVPPQLNHPMVERSTREKERRAVRSSVRGGDACSQSSINALSNPPARALVFISARQQTVPGPTRPIPLGPSVLVVRACSFFSSPVATSPFFIHSRCCCGVAFPNNCLRGVSLLILQLFHSSLLCQSLNIFDHSTT